MMNRKRRNQSGFSLIELLIVVAIILVIAAIAIPNLLKSRNGSINAQAAANLRTLNTAVQTYQTACNTLPTALADMGPSGSVCTQGANSLSNAVIAAGGDSNYSYSFAPDTATQAATGGYTLNATPTAGHLVTQQTFAYYLDGNGHFTYDPTGTAATATSTAVGQ